MRHRKKGCKLGVTVSHKRAMLSNMATSLLQYESIRTTNARAKALRPFVERLITLAKRGDLHARRQVLRVMKNKVVVAKLFDDIAARFVDRPGGYTRIVKLGHRVGDGGQVSLIQLMGAGVVGVKPSVEKKEGGAATSKE
ncbi:MAG: 50S ribosomal protein L17 [Candidatus Latescibacteria bacterium]|nr:50S ribosomal protein L17 [Candidatus Latescibacterota bacterium]